MNQLWQLWEGVLDPKEINKIIKICDAHDNYMNGLIGGSNSEGRSDEGYRSSNIKWIDDSYLNSLIMGYASQANRNAFGFDITGVWDIQYTEYHANQNGKYDWHYDTFWADGMQFDRKISVIIQLSNPKDYVGGDFEIDLQYPQPEGFKTQGSILAFPSFISHRVTQLTHGSRKSLVAWVEGPNFR